MDATLSFLFLGLLSPLPDSYTFSDSITLQVASIEGYQQIIQKQRGKPVLVYFWAHYNVPALKVFPRIVDLHKKYEKKGLVAVSVSLDEDDNKEELNARLLKYLRAKEARFTNILLAASAELWQEKLGLEFAPCIFLYDRNGSCAVFSSGENGLDLQNLEKRIVDTLVEKK